jgi:DNA-binding MarR family transcriptional regulator
MPSRDTTRRRQAVLDSLRELSAANDLLDAAVSDHLSLHRTDLRCLDYLSRFGPIPAGRLGEAVGLTSGALTIAVDRLQRAGYVERKADASDRRKVLVDLAPGAARVVNLFGRLRRTTLRQIAHYSDTDLELVHTFLQAAAHLLEDQARAVRQQTDGHS